MIMKNPPHPGEHILEDYIKPLKITIADMAGILAIDRKSLSRLVNGKTGISALMALRLAIAFPNTTAQFWIRLQTNYDLAQERDNPVLKQVRPAV